MKINLSFALALVAFLCFLSPRLFAQQRPTSPAESPQFWEDKEGLGECSRSRRNFRTAETAAVGDETDWVALRLELKLQPDTAYLEGRSTVTFKPIKQPATALTFELAEALSVSQVRFRGQNLAFERNGRRLSCSLPQPLGVGQTDSISIAYSGSPIKTGFGSFVADTHATGKTVWTLSEPYGIGDWQPGKISLVDKIDTLNIIINAPADFKAVANGTKVAERLVGNRKFTHWRHQTPIAFYLIAVAVAQYEYFECRFADGLGDSLLVRNYIYPQDTAPARQVMTRHFGDITRLFTQKFGPYPFPDGYGHCQFTWGGGMEHQTMSFMGAFTFDLTAHEFAHQWFGDKITCGSWADLWLNEGFATFATGLSYEFLLPQYTYYWLLGQRKRLLQQPSGSVYAYDTTEVKTLFNGSLRYAKGAMALQQLRYLIGDDAFFQAVYNYANDPALAYGYALTPQLQAHFEAASGKSLKRYFDQYIYGKGYPAFTLFWKQNANGYLELAIEQQTSDASVPFFEIPLPVRLKGRDAAGNAVEKDLRLDYRESRTVFGLQPDMTVDSVFLDPNLQLIMAPPTVYQRSDVLSVRVSPNPASGFVTLYWTLAPETLTKIELFDVAGRQVAAFAPEAALYQTQQTFDVSNLAPGLYFLRYTGGLGTTGQEKVLIR